MDSETKVHGFINLEKIIHNKNPKLGKLLPKFLINYIKRIVHVDELNDIIENNKNENGLTFINNALITLGAKAKVYGTERIPKTGRFIFASNHPLGGLDGMILVNEVGKIFPDLKFIVNDLLLNVKNFEDIFVPVNKLGRQNVNYAKIIDSTYKSNEQVLYFPAGLCSRKIKGKITDLTWQKSFILKAVKYERDIIPVFIEGKNSNFFYNLSNFRKFLGIKANIEMLFLVDEMFNQKDKTISVIFGDPVPFTEFNSSKLPSFWAGYVREKVYSLRDLSVT